MISGLIGERSRVIGPLLHEDYAPAIRDAVPYSKRESLSTRADLAEMDALCNYLTIVHGRCPGALLGPVPLHKPDTEARARASTRLDAAGTLDPDQRLLRVLLDDDQPHFEQALVQRLLKHRAGVGADPEPRTLLPVGHFPRLTAAHRAGSELLPPRQGRPELHDCAPHPVHGTCLR